MNTSINDSTPRTRQCILPGCDNTFERTPGSDRKYCSTVCSSRSRSKGDIKKSRALTKKCKRCDELISSSFTYCSECWLTKKTWSRQDKVDKWVSGDTSVASLSSGELSSWARDYLLEVSGQKCSECGWDTPNPSLGRPILTVDHSDGDWSNNEYSNLKILCYNCHTLTPTFGALNVKGKGNRRRSYNRYSEESKINNCIDCGTKISVGALRCYPHSASNRKIEWPEIDELLAMLERSNFSAVARELEVSDNSIRKHLKRLGYDPKTLKKV